MKWYKRLFLLIIIALPFILLSFSIFSICYPFIILYNLISYKKSAYYKAFNIPFTKKFLIVMNILFIIIQSKKIYQ